MANLQELEQQMNSMILEGNVMDAFEKFTHDDVVMKEPGQDPVKGKDANRQREKDFYSSVDQFHGMSLDGWAVNESDQSSFSEWSVDIEFKGGDRVQWSQVERRRWTDDGEVAEVQFFYPPMG